jgi:rhamnulokinase
MLCQFTADATGLPILAGPVEATAIGNIMVQALALGLTSSHAEMRALIRSSFEPVNYEPNKTPEWGEACDRFLELIRSS